MGRSRYRTRTPRREDGYNPLGAPRNTHIELRVGDPEAPARELPRRHTCRSGASLRARNGYVRAFCAWAADCGSAAKSQPATARFPRATSRRAAHRLGQVEGGSATRACLTGAAWPGQRLTGSPEPASHAWRPLYFPRVTVMTP